ncbi:MAG: ATP-dependent DNA helicase [Deltaproteobacteria bacterium]|nr:MAG: ATP-dependent DNA helicase [Deltaproteobacteria bacterium]
MAGHADGGGHGALAFAPVLWPALEEVIGPGGRLATALPGYERRSGQETMMRAVASALERRETLMVEAGTGTGKSLAYLLPAALSGEHVILSTGTRTLQDQLWEKQVPFARDILGIEFEAAILKGRTNYLCLLALDEARRDPRLALDQREDLARIARWAAMTGTGDRAELADLADSSPAWRAVTVDAEQCVGRRCAHFDDCFVMRARRLAERADIVIVNHHLFFADLALKGATGFGLLPDADAVVFDEAHHLEDIAAAHFGFAVSDARVGRFGADVRRALTTAGNGIPEGTANALAALSRDTERLYAAYRRFLPQGRLTRETLSDEILTAYYALDTALGAVARALHAYDTAGAEAITRLIQRGESLRAELAELVLCRRDDLVHWVERGPRAVFLRAAPIEVGALFRDVVFARFGAVVLTSATLTTQGTFDHYRARLGLPDDAHTLNVASPFDYANQALIYVPDDLPAPNSEAWLDAAAERIAELVGLTRGRALLLFTSFRAMRGVHARIADRLEHPVMMQGEGSRESLLKRLRTEAGSVLFATATFWEGVDVVGDALSLVVIDRLPFAPPGDPMVDARIGALTSAGRNAFMEYQVPSAIISLKQGFGRLIRHRTDRGIVAILDPRLTRSRYGAAFLRSLPPARRTANLRLLASWWDELSGGEARLEDDA